MVSCIKSCNLKGMETEIIYAECDIARGLPVLNIVGLPDTSVKEAKERLRAAIVNSGLSFPLSRRITINLSPADTKKEGTHMDPMTGATRRKGSILSLTCSEGPLFCLRSLKEKGNGC